MFKVLLDFNGTMVFDASLHKEAWSKIYRELHPGDTGSLDMEVFYGPHNDEILQKIAPFLSAEERLRASERKEELYRQSCLIHPEIFRLVDGTEDFLDHLKTQGIPFGLASASIKPNIDFFFEHLGLDRWFRIDDVVYDDGSYANKGAMHLEAARRLNSDLSECLLVEDSPSSISLAKQNGAGCIVALGHSAPVNILFAKGANYHIPDFTRFDYRWLARK